MNVGIIGTAGRKSDADQLSLPKYQAMKAAVLGILAPYTGAPITFVSGGAAVADHIAVQLFLALPNTKLSLHLPAEYDIQNQRFVEIPGNIFAPGNIANYYHRQFAKRCGQNSQAELTAAINRGASVLVTPGFKQRNTKVAMEAEVMIALTFGDGAVLKDGGTLDTLSKFLARKTGTSFHICLPDCQVFSPALDKAPEENQPEFL